MRAGAARMHDALRNALAVEMGDLLDELVVLRASPGRAPDGRRLWLSGTGWPWRVVNVLSSSFIFPSLAGTNFPPVFVASWVNF